MEKKVRSRSLTVGLFFTLFFLALIAKVYWVQVAERSWLMAKAEKIWQESEKIPAKRGEISDRYGKVLAEDGTAYIVTLNPMVIHEKGLEKEVSGGLAPILATSDAPADIAKLEAKLYEMATRKRQNSEKLAVEVEVQSEGYKIDAETKDKIDVLIASLKEKIEARNKATDGKKLDTKQVGITLHETTKRSYPFGRLASHVLGFMDKWGKPGGYGLESSLDDLLKGTEGHLDRERDPYGVALPNGKMSYTAPINGKNVALTIDQNIQYYVENALRQVYDKWQPRGATAIAANPKTGEILAMANMPDYDPNKYWQAKDNSVFRNNAVAYTYEPGSTFKLVTLAGAVEEKKFNPNETYQSGSIVIDDRKLHDHNGVGWGKISYMEGLLRSSNVAFVKLGIEKLGTERLSHYINDFGFGAPTNIDLPGEQSGIVKMKYKPEFATSTYGQGLTVTAIQQLASYGAVANGGKLMKPYIIKEITDQETGEVVQSNSPQMVRQVISEAAAKEISLDLEQVVANKDMGGTGWRAYIDGYRVAGKTGTANIVLPGEKGYSSDKWLITFAGYAPVENPQIVVVIVVDVPDLKGDYHLGGEVASPAFKEIVSQSLSYLGVTSAATSAQMSRLDTVTVVPDTVGAAVSAAKTMLSQSGLRAEVIGDGADVVKQLPLPGTKIPQSQRVYLMTQEDTANVPNLTGKSLRDALEVCSLLGIKCKTEGEGYVVNQTLNGDENNRELTLTLKPAEAIASDDTAGKTSNAGTSSPGAKGTAASKENQSPAKATPTPKTSSIPKSTSTSSSKSTPTPSKAPGGQASKQP